MSYSYPSDDSPSTSIITNKLSNDNITSDENEIFLSNNQFNQLSVEKSLAMNLKISAKINSAGKLSSNEKNNSKDQLNDTINQEVVIRRKNSPETSKATMVDKSDKLSSDDKELNDKKNQNELLNKTNQDLERMDSPKNEATVEAYSSNSDGKESNKGSQNDLMGNDIIQELGIKDLHGNLKVAVIDSSSQLSSTADEFDEKTNANQNINLSQPFSRKDSSPESWKTAKINSSHLSTNIFADSMIFKSLLKNNQNCNNVDSSTKIFFKQKILRKVFFHLFFTRFIYLISVEDWV